jgi:hypothetical protein
MKTLSQSGKSFNINKLPLILEQTPETSKSRIAIKAKLVNLFLLEMLACVFAEVGPSGKNKEDFLFRPKRESEAAGRTEVKWRHGLREEVKSDRSIFWSLKMRSS